MGCLAPRDQLCRFKTFRFKNTHCYARTHLPAAMGQGACPALDGALLELLVASAAAGSQNLDLVLARSWANCLALSPLCCSVTRRPQDPPLPGVTYLAVLCQQVDVVLIDLLHLLQLAAAQLPLGDVSVVDFGAQLPGQDSQGFSLWREGVEDLRKGKAKRVLRREEQKDGAERQSWS